jgi:hypothetical protein
MGLQNLLEYKKFCVLSIVVATGLVFGILEACRAPSQWTVFAGGMVGVISSLIVMIATFFQPDRQPLLTDFLFWRAFCDFGVGIRMAFSRVLDKRFLGNADPDVLNTSAAGCSFPSAFLEFFIIAAQLWVFVLAADLIRSLKYPFSSSQNWARTSQTILWSASLVLALATGLDRRVYGYYYVEATSDVTGICFISSHKGRNTPAIYILFYIPIIICVVVGCIGIGYTYRRLKHGIPSTIIPRIRAVSGNIINILIYIVFTSILLLPLTAAFFAPGNDNVFLRLLFYLVGAEGISALIVLIMARNRVDLSASLRQDILTYATRGIRSCAEPVVTSDANNVISIEADVEPDLGKLDLYLLIQFLIGNEEELLRFVDLQLAYRNSRGTALEPVDGNQRAIAALDLESKVDRTDSRDSNRLTNLLVTTPSNESGGLPKTNVCTFTEVAPLQFHRIRTAASISSEDYRAQFRKTAKARVTKGGASGAFFFFSNDDLFVAKSCLKSEFDVLVQNASKFADYFESPEGQNSFIGRVYGAYSMTLYGIEVYFFVMANLLCAKDDEGNRYEFEERYDLKGSTVGRGVVYPDDGDRCTCTGCKVKFTYVAKNRRAKKVKGMNAGPDDYLENCRCTVSGKHEPNLLCKDNDLKFKLRLYPESAKAVASQLESDAAFLCRIGVMDYSLLLGVHHMNYHRGNGVETSSTAAGISGSGSQRFQDELKRKRFEAASTIGPDFYQFGIIDFLQTWDANKKMERFFKVRILGKSSYGLSAIEPDIYRDRFVNHLKSVFGVEDESDGISTRLLNSDF